MVKCRDCKAEMVYIPAENNEVILICPNPNCNFKSSPIKLAQSYINIEEEKDLVEKREDEQVNNFISEICGTKTFLNRSGKVDEILIYCVDFSTRMDIEIKYGEESINQLKEQIKRDNLISESLKNCNQAVLRAEQAYSEIASFGMVLDQKSRDDHIMPLLDGMRQFRERAEL